MATTETTPSTAAARTEPWQTIVARKRQQCKDLIPEAWKLPQSITDGLRFPLESNPNRLLEMDIPKRSGILSEKELKITESYEVGDLLSALADGSLTALEVTIAFSKRAAIAQQLTSCLTETLFDEAQERAKYLDECRAEGKLVGPLHGLPISLKDSFKIRGHETSIGFVSFLGKKATENSALVDILLELGAVLYVKTNIPQTLMTADSDNNVFGRTLNPNNTALTAGGSSGGEGALIAFRGSLLGVGTDIAGSIRIPSICCGTYGFKPTPSRIPYGGQATPALPGLRTILASAGPLARDFKALGIFTKAVIDAEPARLDVTALDVPWRPKETLKLRPSSRLTIGVLPEDPTCPLQPPIKRAISEATYHLQAAGHNIVALSAEECHIANASETSFETFIVDTKTSLDHINASGEPLIPSVAAAASPVTNGKFIPSDLREMDMLHKLAALAVYRDKIMDDWRKIWQEKKLDVVIGPGAPFTAPPHDTYGWPPYTVLLNVLDYPACIIPYTRASKETDHPQPEQKFTPEYNPDLSDGSPCHIQVFTSRMRDEECLAAAEIIDACLKK